MNLEIQNGPIISDPDASTINEALQKLDGDKSYFAILSDDHHSFLQVAGDRQAAYTLEYKDAKNWPALCLSGRRQFQSCR